MGLAILDPHMSSLISLSLFHFLGSSAAFITLIWQYFILNHNIKQERPCRWREMFGLLISKMISWRLLCFFMNNKRTEVLCPGCYSVVYLFYVVVFVTCLCNFICIYWMWNLKWLFPSSVLTYFRDSLLVEL